MTHVTMADRLLDVMQSRGLMADDGDAVCCPRGALVYGWRSCWRCWAPSGSAGYPDGIDGQEDCRWLSKP